MKHDEFLVKANEYQVLKNYYTETFELRRYNTFSISVAVSYPNICLFCFA
jgi:hypothetical protein